MKLITTVAVALVVVITPVDMAAQSLAQSLSRAKALLLQTQLERAADILEAAVAAAPANSDPVLVLESRAELAAAEAQAGALRRARDKAPATSGRDEVRKAMTKEEKVALKGTRWSLQKREWNLTDADVQTLEQLEQVNQPIYRAHMLKESLASILDGRQINVARRRLERWIGEAKGSGLVHFVRVAGTIETYLDGILAYIRSRLSNGRTEGLNGKIRTITRRSFGFHSAGALIAMIFLCCGGVHVTPAFSAPSSFH